MLTTKRPYQFWLITAISVWSAIVTPPTYGQVASDGTLSTEVATPDNLNFKITGGSKVENNLFHSFQEFSIPIGGSAVFADQGVDNIISRVTGGSISDIQGLIQTQGHANFFLINPNGIIFGPDAQLDIRGSFLATTANRINFADGRSFSATASHTQPLLSVSTPIGLQFGANVKPIDNQSQAENSSTGFVGLQVESGRTLALVGGDITLEKGKMIVPEGRIELGSVGDNSFVSLTPIGGSINTGWRLGYEDVPKFRDIRLLSANVSASTVGTSGGEIYFRGRNIIITDKSQVLGFNPGDISAGIIAIQASESVELSDRSQLLFNSEELPGTAGNINIETQRLLVSNRSSIDASTYTEGRGGNITINSPESVEVRGNGQLTQIATQAYGDGNAGELKVTTGTLILSDGGQIASSTFKAGNGGTVTVKASESIAISGQGQNGNQTEASGLFARTRGVSATGNGGELSINTGRLIIRDGGSISAASVEGSTGQAGSLNINAVDSVEVSGKDSSLQASSASPKSAGNLTITTDKLVVQDGARVNVSSTNAGNTGNLTIAARTISLDNGGQLTATSSSGNGGNITLQKLESLVLRDQSKISTNAQGAGNGGNINIKTKLLVGLENSDITANAFDGEGGFIQIDTKGLFGLEVREQLTKNSDITAFSQKNASLNGVIEIDRLENNPEGALLTLPAEPVNISGLIAQGCSSGAGSIARKGSEFVITGRGGLPPTPKEAFRGDVALVDLGKPIEAEATQAKVVTPTNNNQNHSESTELVEAQGWVIGSDGEVTLTASAPNVTPSIPWMKSNSCHG